MNGIIPVRVAADAPLHIVRDDCRIDTAHPLYATPCPVCAEPLQDDQPLALVYVGVDPDDRKDRGFMTGAAVAVHAACTGSADRAGGEDDPAPSSLPEPLAVGCAACLASPGESCIGTTSDLPRERPHKLRPLAAAACLVRCSDCDGTGWRPTAPLLAPQVTCPVCGAGPGMRCTEGGRRRDYLHDVRRRAARAGLEPCGTCLAVGWVPDGQPERGARA